MATTAKQKIYYPTDTTRIDPLAGQFALLATSTEDALNRTPYTPSDLDALSAITGASATSTALVVEGGALFRYSGTAWVQSTPATFATADARDSAYGKASGAYKVNGAKVTRSDRNYTEEWTAAIGGIPAGFRPVSGVGLPFVQISRNTDYGVVTNTVQPMFNGPMTPTGARVKSCAFDGTYGAIHLGDTGQSYGRWRISASGFWAGSATGQRIMEIRSASTAAAIASGYIWTRDVRAGNSAGISSQVSGIIVSESADLYVSVSLYQDSGNNLNLLGGSSAPILLNVEYLGPVNA